MLIKVPNLVVLFGFPKCHSVFKSQLKPCLPLFLQLFMLVCLFVPPPPPRLIEQGVVGTTYSGTQYNEEPRDWENAFVITGVRYIGGSL